MRKRNWPLHRAVLIATAATLALFGLPLVWIFLSFRQEYGDTELVRAAAMGDVAKVRARLRQGSPANSYHIEGSSALWWAVDSGSPETVQVLLEHGADPNSTGQWNTVIVHAVQMLNIGDGKPRRAVIQALLNQAGRIKDPSQVQLLKDALAEKRPAATGEPTPQVPAR